MDGPRAEIRNLFTKQPAPAWPRLFGHGRVGAGSIRGGGGLKGPDPPGARRGEIHKFSQTPRSPRVAQPPEGAGAAVGGSGVGGGEPWPRFPPRPALRPPRRPGIPGLGLSRRAPSWRPRGRPQRPGRGKGEGAGGRGAEQGEAGRGPLPPPAPPSAPRSRESCLGARPAGPRGGGRRGARSAAT